MNNITKTTATTATKSVWNLNKVNLFVDLGIFAAFFVARDAHMTGITIHEWFGLAFVSMLLTHLLLHWRWVVAVTRKFFSQLPTMTRLNYVLNALLLLDFGLIAVSGIMISRSVVPVLGLSISGGRQWEGLHHLSANIVFVLVGLHVVSHWRWIVDAVKRYIIAPLTGNRLNTAALNRGV